MHRAQRRRVIRPEVRFTPCQSSAVQGLRLAFFGMAPVVWGPRPGSAWEYHVEREERGTTALCLDL